jgi:thiamine-monophosphate kinase
MKEFDFIKIASNIFRKKKEEVIAGAGEDDCAVVRVNDKYLLFTADSLHEKTDFPKQMLPLEIGHMALAVNLSDLAGSGAKPEYFLYTISLREGIDEEFFSQILTGIKNLADKYDVGVIGGDIDFADELYISGFAAGFAERFVLQSGARPGDKVWMTDITGKAQLALEMLFSGKERDEVPFIKSLLTPEPRIDEGLKASSYASAMTDISDSLAISLNLIARKSGVKIEILEDLLDLSELTEIVNYNKALELFLYGGGDFELVFTAEEDEDINGMEIGKVEEGEGVKLKRKSGGSVEVQFRGYSHF